MAFTDVGSDPGEPNVIIVCDRPTFKLVEIEKRGIKRKVDFGLSDQEIKLR
jgi:hypothetical protein